MLELVFGETPTSSGHQDAENRDWRASIRRQVNSKPGGFSDDPNDNHASETVRKVGINIDQYICGSKNFIYTLIYLQAVGQHPRAIYIDDIILIRPWEIQGVVRGKFSYILN